MKRIFKWAGILAGIAVIIFNICWFYNYSLFREFTDNTDEIIKFITFVSREEGYVYHVKCPSYLSFIGNLTVGTENNDYVLFIWPSRFIDTKYGVMVPYDKDSSTQLMITRDLVTEYAEDQHFVDRDREIIEGLFLKAERRWGEGFE